jgi:hypothetical protein
MIRRLKGENVDDVCCPGEVQLLRNDEVTQMTEFHGAMDKQARCHGPAETPATRCR